MKAEQACRFRLDEGYGIYSKSAGLTSVQAEAMGTAFNSTMNTMFPQLGTSLLSCATVGESVFLARNTLRTDAMGRTTIFTHTYIFDAEDYAEQMQKDPAALLSVPMSKFLDAQPADTQMDQLDLDLSADTSFSLEALFEKYRLTPDRYGKLLLGVYEAVTSNASLRLKTDLPLARTEQMVRELTYCILVGLLPVLRNKVSFSSGADTRMTISVIPQGDRSAQSSDIIFGVEDDSYTNIRPKSEVTALAFEALGRASHQERSRILENMQFWLGEMTDVQEGLSVMLVAVAYCLSSGRELSQELMLLLFRSISSGGSRFSRTVANGLLTGLVQRMNEQGKCSTAALSQIAGWYLKDSSAAYRAEADRSFAAAPVDICAALVEVLFEQEMTDKVRQMLHTLLNRIPSDSGALSDEAQTKTILWILGENVEAFSQYATALMSNYNNEQILQLAKGILSGLRGRLLTGSEDAVLAKALDYLTTVKIPLTEAECAGLDSLNVCYSEALTNAALNYLFEVRLATKRVEDGLELLEKFYLQMPLYFEWIYRELSSGKRNCVELFEHFQANHCFHKGMSLKELQEVCRNDNVFNNPCGVFESEVIAHFMDLLHEEFEEMIIIAGLEYYFTTLLPRWQNVIEDLNVSEQAKQKMLVGISKSFWEVATYEKIRTNEKPLPELLTKAPADAKKKVQVFDLCMNLRRNPTDTRMIIDLIQSEQTDEAFLKELKSCARMLLGIFLKKHKYVSWDLLLLMFWEQTEKGGAINTERLFGYCDAKFDPYFKRQYHQFRMETEYSLLLKDEKIAKSIAKLGNDLPGVLQILVDQLNAGKKGLLQNLFGGAKEKKAAEPQRGGRYAAGSNKGGRYFDPTADAYDDWNSRGNKKGKGGR